MRYFLIFSILVFILIVACASAFLSSCAVQMRPEGGDKDSLAPEVQQEDPPSGSTSVSGDKITISFDEYITIQNASQEVIISPQLEVRPAFTVKRKSLIVDFSKSNLQSNTTYSLYFGKAIRDNTEGNILNDYRYVFATGSVIDTQQVTGTVVQALLQKPQAGATVMLYSKADTVGPRTVPRYVTKANEQGNFRLFNVARDEYQLLALEDKNNNYRYDADEAAVLVKNVPVDSVLTFTGDLALFPPLPDSIKLVASEASPGKLQVKTKGRIVAVHTEAHVPLAYQLNEGRDSITVWARVPKDSAWVQLALDNGRNELVVNEFIPAFTIGANTLKLAAGSDLEAINRYGSPLMVYSAEPILSADLMKMKLTQEGKSLPIAGMAFIDSSHTNMILMAGVQPDLEYKLELEPGAVQTFHGKVSDSFSDTYSLPSRRNYGLLDIEATVDSTSPQWLFQLVNENGSVFFQKVLNQSERIVLPYIPPAVYQMRLVADRNRNGRWDTGIVGERAPEEVRVNPQPINVKANWEIKDLRVSSEW